MFVNDLSTNERFETIHREAKERARRRTLARDALRAQRGQGQRPWSRRARTRLGDAFVSAGLAIAGPVDECAAQERSVA